LRVRPGKNDHKHGVRIRGAELRELKLIDLPESFGLDRRIERYEGKRPMGLYRWDLDGLLAALSLVLEDRYQPTSAKGQLALKTLYDRLRTEYDSAYGKTGT
jgi:hypothetical protein